MGGIAHGNPLQCEWTVLKGIILVRSELCLWKCIGHFWHHLQSSVAFLFLSVAWILGKVMVNSDSVTKLSQQHASFNFPFYLLKYKIISEIVVHCHWEPNKWTAGVQLPLSTVMMLDYILSNTLYDFILKVLWSFILVYNSKISSWQQASLKCVQLCSSKAVPVHWELVGMELQWAVWFLMPGEVKSWTRMTRLISTFSGQSCGRHQG